MRGILFVVNVVVSSKDRKKKKQRSVKRALVWACLGVAINCTATETRFCRPLVSRRTDQRRPAEENT